MEPALHQKSPLDAESRNQEVESDGAKAVALQKGHEEPKAHEDHDVNILKTCRKNKQNISNSVNQNHSGAHKKSNRKKCCQGCKHIFRIEKPRTFEKNLNALEQGFSNLFLMPRTHKNYDLLPNI